MLSRCDIPTFVIRTLGPNHVSPDLVPTIVALAWTFVIQSRDIPAFVIPIWIPTFVVPAWTFVIQSWDIPTFVILIQVPNSIILAI